MASDLSPENRRWILETIRKELRVLCTGQTGLINDAKTDTVDNMYPGMGSLLQIPVARTWGVVSRPPMGTNQLVGKVGDHPGARVVLGYLDQDAPTPDPEGGVILYDGFGNQIGFDLDGIHVGSTGADSPMVLGDVMSSALSDIFDQIKFILDQFISGSLATTTTPGNVTAPWPALVASATLQETSLAEQKLKYVTNPATSIKSLTVFTER